MRCQVCEENEAKYKCPACSRQTCGLGCVNKHKVDAGCSGKRPRSDQVAIRDFDDNVLHRDFNLLEDSQSSLYRCRPTAKPDHLRKRDKLKSECYQRSIHLKLMPHVFSLAKSNSSTLRTRKDPEGNTVTEIMWKVDWKFPLLDTTLSDTCVSELKTLRELLTRFFDNSWKLGPTRHLFTGTDASVDALEVFLVNYQKQEVSVSLDATLRDALRDQAILEYPTFIVKQVLMLPPRPPNIPLSVWSRIGRNLYQDRTHPVGIVSGLIHDHFKSLHGGSVFESASLPSTPIVTTRQAFDDLLVPKNHILRSASDTYYVTPDTVLRPHATSHQRAILESLRTEKKEGKIWTCDVYRKDEVDRIHFPVFHQTDGVRVFESFASESAVVEDLKQSLEGLMGRLFDEAGRKLILRWDKTATFPFTHPSLEMEIQLENGPKGDPVWVECLGCGKIRPEIDPNGWAFGIGIDRLAMLLFEIDDIRTLWSLDSRFTQQFVEGKITKFKPFSKYPATYRDTAFWQTKDVDPKRFEFEVMQLAGPLGLESIQLIDAFTHPKSGKKSLCFRFTYRGIEKTLTSEECNEIHTLVNQYVTDTAEGVIRT